MHDRSTRVEVKALRESGLSKSATARRLGVDRRTVGRWESRSSTTERKRRAHKLDPYKEIVRTRLATYPELSAQRLFEEVRAAGYDGEECQEFRVQALSQFSPEGEKIFRFSDCTMLLCLRRPPARGVETSLEMDGELALGRLPVQHRTPPP